MKTNAKHKVLLKWIAAAVLLFFAVFFVEKRGFSNGNEAGKTTASDGSDTAEVSLEGYQETENAISAEKVLQLHDEYEKDAEINPDVKGILCFNSELIHQPVLQGDTNDTYLRTDWKNMKHLSWGSVFVDSANDLATDDQNLIVYGHYVYPNVTEDRTKVFTPLDTLKDHKYYEKNRYLAFVMDKEVRYYEMSVLYECPLETIDGVEYPVIDMQYNLINYEDSYFDEYMDAVSKHLYYETEAEPLTLDDHILTLQTCIEGNDHSREIILCREIGRNSMEDVREYLNQK